VNRCSIDKNWFARCLWAADCINIGVSSTKKDKGIWAKISVD